MLTSPMGSMGVASPVASQPAPGSLQGLVRATLQRTHAPLAERLVGVTKLLNGVRSGDQQHARGSLRGAQMEGPSTNNSSMADLEAVFVLLMSDIFGSAWVCLNHGGARPGRGWGLININK